MWSSSLLFWKKLIPPLQISVQDLNGEKRGLNTLNAALILLSPGYKSQQRKIRKIGSLSSFPGALESSLWQKTALFVLFLSSRTVLYKLFPGFLPLYVAVSWPTGVHMWCQLSGSFFKWHSLTAALMLPVSHHICLLTSIHSCFPWDLLHKGSEFRGECEMLTLFQSWTDSPLFSLMFLSFSFLSSSFPAVSKSNNRWMVKVCHIAR